MSPEAYRQRWGLPRDYPMVAPAYAAQRSSVAKRLGLGRRKPAPVPQPPEPPPAPTEPRRRAASRKKAAA
jgi:predicted transcriptional regulator